MKSKKDKDKGFGHNVEYLLIKDRKKFYGLVHPEVANDATQILLRDLQTFEAHDCKLFLRDAYADLHELEIAAGLGAGPERQSVGVAVVRLIEADTNGRLFCFTQSHIDYWLGEGALDLRCESSEAP